MRSGDELPTNRENDSLIQAIVSISHGGMGLTMVTDDLNRVIGVFTDGDLRRLFDAQKGFAIDLSAMQLSDYMHDRPMTIHQQALAAEALQIMEENRISALPIIDDKQQIVGAINMHDLLRAGIA